MARILLLLPSTTYRTEAFVSAAERLGVDVTVGAEYANMMTKFNPSALLKLSLPSPQQAADEVFEFAKQFPIDAVVGVDDQVTETAAAIAERLGLRHNSIRSVGAAQNKFLMRQHLANANIASPRFMMWRPGLSEGELLKKFSFPLVVKPLNLAASQGVIRANHFEEFEVAIGRVQKIIQDESVSSTASCESRSNTVASNDCDSRDCGSVQKEAVNRIEPQIDAAPILVEEFASGAEVALEGLLTNGKLHLLALFDKPEQSDGPYFEETIYVTPSRQSTEQQQAILETAQQAAAALGLVDGPVHAELRLPATGPVIIEINPRSIGGKCSKTLKFGEGLSLEELIISRSLDDDFEPPQLQPKPSGVMMIPIRESGELQEIVGVSQAEETPYVEEVSISAHVGQTLTMLPEGSAYLGFIFARAESVDAVETALKKAYHQLKFVVS